MATTFECAVGDFALHLNSSTGLYSMACLDQDGIPYMGGLTFSQSSDGGGGTSPDPVTSFVDGHILGWGVALAMAAAWGMHILRRSAT